MKAFSTDLKSLYCSYFGWNLKWSWRDPPGGESVKEILEGLTDRVNLFSKMRYTFRQQPRYKEKQSPCGFWFFSFIPWCACIYIIASAAASTATAPVILHETRNPVSLTFILSWRLVTLQESLQAFITRLGLVMHLVTLTENPEFSDSSTWRQPSLKYLAYTA